MCAARPEYLWSKMLSSSGPKDQLYAQKTQHDHSTYMYVMVVHATHGRSTTIRARRRHLLGLQERTVCGSLTKLTTFDRSSGPLLGIHMT